MTTSTRPCRQPPHRNVYPDAVARRCRASSATCSSRSRSSLRRLRRRPIGAVLGAASVRSSRSSSASSSCSARSTSRAASAPSSSSLLEWAGVSAHPPARRGRMPALEPGSSAGCAPSRQRPLLAVPAARDGRDFRRRRLVTLVDHRHLGRDRRLGGLSYWFWAPFIPHAIATDLLGRRAGCRASSAADASRPAVVYDACCTSCSASLFLATLPARHARSHDAALVDRRAACSAPAARTSCSARSATLERVARCGDLGRGSLAAPARARHPRRSAAAPRATADGSRRRRTPARHRPRQGARRSSPRRCSSRRRRSRSCARCRAASRRRSCSTAASSPPSSRRRCAAPSRRASSTNCPPGTELPQEIERNAYFVAQRGARQRGQALGRDRRRGAGRARRHDVPDADETWLDVVVTDNGARRCRRRRGPRHSRASRSGCAASAAPSRSRARPVARRSSRRTCPSHAVAAADVDARPRAD